MKKLLLIAIALVTVNTPAQELKKERQHRGEHERVKQFKDFSPEEIATLQTKKLVLALDLIETQQKQIQALHLEQAKARRTAMEARKKLREEGKDEQPSKEDRFKRANEQLDSRIALKTKMKNILNKEQFDKWERGNAIRGKQRAKIHKKEGQKKMTKKRKQRH